MYIYIYICVCVYVCVRACVSFQCALSRNVSPFHIQGPICTDIMSWMPYI